VVDRREGALVALEATSVQGEPTSSWPLHLRSHHDVGVELRIAGSAGVLAKHRRSDPVGVDDDHLTVGRHAGDRLAVDELDQRGDGCLVSGNDLPTNLGRCDRPRGLTPTSAPST